MKRAAHGWGETRKELQCKTCNAYTTLPTNSLTYTCPFCSSNKVIQHQAPQDVLRPRFLIPFTLEAGNCHKITQTWLGNSWTVPKELKNIATLKQIQGIYLPFWTFDARNNATWTALVGHRQTYYHKGVKKSKIVWRSESGQVEHYVDDLLITGTTHLSNHLLDQIQPYHLEKLVPYKADYLAGFQAHAYDIPLEKGWTMARHIMREKTRQICRKKPSRSRVRNFRMNLNFTEEAWRYILLPAYIASYTYSNKTYQLIINGQTGAIAGQRPISWPKITLVVAALLLPGLILATTGFILYYTQAQQNIFVILGFILLVLGMVGSGITIAHTLKINNSNSIPNIQKNA